MTGARSFGATLAGIMERRYIAAIDIAREVGVAPRQVERWLRDEAAPSPVDVRTLAGLLGGADGARLLAAGTGVEFDAQADSSPTPRPMSPKELAVLGGLPPVFRAEFAAALGRQV